MILGGYLVAKYVKTINEYIVCLYFVISNLKPHFSYNNKMFIITRKFKKVFLRYC